MTNRIASIALLVGILVVTVIVVTGIGQGSPPKKLPISTADIQREIAAVNAGSSEVKLGEHLFSAHGCSDCHTLAAGHYGGRLGPRLDVQSQGDPIHAVEANITDPPDDDKGYEAGLMPDDYGTRLSKADLLALATYIHEAAGAAAGK